MDVTQSPIALLVFLRAVIAVALHVRFVVLIVLVTLGLPDVVDGVVVAILLRAARVVIVENLERSRTFN